MVNAGIRVRSYNVGFGDCFLVTFPDGRVTRNMLVDFGNAPGQVNTGYPEIAQNIYDETNGHLDVLVMTHEHLDHMEGFYAQKGTFSKMKVDYVWMSLPSHPTYYIDYPKAQPLKRIRELAAAFEKRLKKQNVLVAPKFLTLLQNNLSNPQRIDYIRNLTGNPKRVLYLSRGAKPDKPFSRSVKIKVLAPEKDVSIYYGGSSPHGLQAMSRCLTGASNFAEEAGGNDSWAFPNVPREKRDPVNLSGRDWRLLHETIQSGGVESVRAIDRAANNTSLVFSMEVAGRRLLFPGDAELESWDVMQEKCLSDLKPIDFLKVSHHGSHNGTSTELLAKLLPASRKDKATVMVSTKSKVYGTVKPVPDAELLKLLKSRCRNLISTDGEKKLWVDANL